ncbi:hypothetical protein M408DRAFT_27574 [Serendipita vermifera MAFF 305830]|uniref:Uncharacterized protein n=1 Tax=Serendipita vermifera MAFF 305830 TaxID=933852 RepID=A0A0C2WBQ5_SERVB|nr:hypothetical protein M408DRAFT_27574 [Serendipita vermifera MAFF 305830]
MSYSQFTVFAATSLVSVATEYFILSIVLVESNLCGPAKGAVKAPVRGHDATREKHAKPGNFVNEEDTVAKLNSVPVNTVPLTKIKNRVFFHIARVACFAPSIFETLRRKLNQHPTLKNRVTHIPSMVANSHHHIAKYFRPSRSGALNATPPNE